MKIWLDLANSPQVLFFRPLAAELQCRGHCLAITTRAYAQTVPLADRLGLAHTVIGRHGGLGRGGLIYQLGARAFSLAGWARRQRFDLAVSHNSYSQIVAATLLRVPAVTLMDYEHQPLNHLAFRLARRVIVPEAFPAERLRHYGAGGKAVTYPGVKEQVYLADFTAEPDFRERHGLPTNAVLAVLRPPATWTAYAKHRASSDLFEALVRYLAARPEVHVLVLPRLPAQADWARAMAGVNVPSQVYDGPSLLNAADLVAGGGGTMNREAAVLGAPAYTVFTGALAAVDRYLMECGRLIRLETEADFAQIELNPPAPRQPRLAGGPVVERIADQLLSSVQN